MKSYLLAFCLAAGTPVLGAETQPPYLFPNQPIETRVADLLSRLTLEEKISLIHADSKFSTAGVPRLGIPARWMSDGPHGVREEVGPDSWRSAGRTDDFCTAMPVCICLSATWDSDLARAYGEVIGQEARERGKDIMLAPVINIVRTPLGGRNCEYFSEDPWLTSRMADAYIRGEQSQDVASCAVIFALNNQEHDRFNVNVEVDERALHEIFFPAFKAAVQEAGVWSVMGAYNQFRGQHCAENDYLLNQTLKGRWGFQGFVVSDWGAAHTTRGAALNGLDVEMGTEKSYTNFFLGQPYLDGLKNGEYPMAGLDDKVRRSLRVMIATHVFDPGRANGSLNTPAHEAIARRTAEEGVVLLKNENHALPLDPAKIKSIAVIGENAIRLHSGGGNSFGLKPFYEITPLQGILNRVGSDVNITFAEGYRKNGTNFLADRAVAAAKAADVVIYVGGLNHDLHFDSEGADRRDLKLPYGQDELIQKIVAVNPRTI
ncbi:MAG: glycoside hydrolase family 3 N-terminal domain-containing protein, partial [Verrucomicrobiota bacterium]